MAGDSHSLSSRVIDLLEGPLASHGFELLDVRVFRGGGRMTLRVYVDTENGVSVGDCASASRTAGMLLEEAGVPDEAYVIEVTSPGVRRPLRTKAHFQAVVGQNVILKVAADRGSRTLKGELREVGTETLVVVPAADGVESGGEVGPVGVDVPFAAIREANLDPEFDVQALINADRRRRKDEKKKAREARRGQKNRRNG